MDNLISDRISEKEISRFLDSKKGRVFTRELEVKKKKILDLKRITQADLDQLITI